MTKKIYTGLVTVIILMMVTSCSTTVKTEQPPEYYDEAEYFPTYSYVNLPFEVEVSKLEKAINREFSGLIYSDTSFEDNDHDNLMIKAWKTGDMHLRANGNMLSYSVPLHVVIKKRFEIGPSILNLSDVREVSADLVMKLKTRIVLNPDWTVSATTFSDGNEWLSTPTVKVGSINIPLPVICDAILDANQKEINDGIDNALTDYLDLRSKMKGMWKEIQVPLRISDIYPVWTRITPFELRAMPVTSDGGMIRFTAGVKARSECFYGDEPAYVVNDTLPDVKITSRLDHDFHLNLVLDVPFTIINDLTHQEVAGMTLKQGKYSVLVKDVFLYGNGENLVVALNVDGSIRGTIYLTGKLYFNSERKTLMVTDLDFDVRTKNVLIKSASWIFHQGLTKTIGQKLEYPIGDELQVIRTSVQSYLNQGNRIDYFRITGNLDNLDIQNILITRKSIKAVFTLSGILKIEML